MSCAKLEKIRNCIVDCVEAEICGGLEEVDTCELGQAIDMIKDMEEALYHHKACEKLEVEKYYREENLGCVSASAMNQEYMGKSYQSRRDYLDARYATPVDREACKKKLEDYARDLGMDIMEMLQESTPEEKQIIQQKLAVLVNKLK